MTGGGAMPPEGGADTRLDTMALGIVGPPETGPVRATLPVADPPIARSLGLDGGGLPIIHSEVPPEKLRALGHYQGVWAGRSGLAKHYADREADRVS